MTQTTAQHTITRSCSKCEGTGVVQAFAHVAGGTCFDCGGAGQHVTTTARERARKAAAKRRAVKRDAAAQSHVDRAMRDAKASGMSLQQYHDSVCSCGGDCTRTWNDGAMGAQWDAA